jgi:hypothetical protein
VHFELKLGVGVEILPPGGDFGQQFGKSVSRGHWVL